MSSLSPSAKKGVPQVPQRVSVEAVQEAVGVQDPGLTGHSEDWSSLLTCLLHRAGTSYGPICAVLSMLSCATALLSSWSRRGDGTSALCPICLCLSESPTALALNASFPEQSVGLSTTFLCSGHLACPLPIPAGLAEPCLALLAHVRLWLCSLDLAGQLPGWLTSWAVPD